ncbi:MAG: nucleotide sugar dehydrogenase [Holosporaceae bacterium]|jgi:UDPglucose 6-dehydrogenase|nr:nucleotide sugar dehydrogenase [Holosporaceae bacterium]
MKICVQGLWHLGCVTSAALASLKHEVIALDYKSHIIKKLNSGLSPIFEPGLESMMQQCLRSGHLEFTDSPERALESSEILWITYDTPVDDNDVADTGYVIEQVKRSLPFLPAGAIVLVSSQLPVGSVRCLEKIARDKNLDLHFAYSPENLRLGQALEVFLNPDRIVVGCRKNDRVKDILESLLSSITANLEWVSIESAEMTKHAINTFLALSVTFANEIASICESVGADASEVARGMKTEQRIGQKAYLLPGGAFSGGTLARDVNFLSEVAKKNTISSQLINAINSSNNNHKKWIWRKINSMYDDLEGKCIAIWGLTYKANTNTLRRSTTVDLVSYLLERKACVNVYDPLVETLPSCFGTKEVVKLKDPIESIRGADVLIVSTSYNECKQIDPEKLKKSNPNLKIIDINRLLIDWNTAGFEYHTIGKP